MSQTHKFAAGSGNEKVLDDLNVALNEGHLCPLNFDVVVVAFP